MSRKRNAPPRAKIKTSRCWHVFPFFFLSIFISAVFSWLAVSSGISMSWTVLSGTFYATTVPALALWWINRDVLDRRPFHAPNRSQTGWTLLVAVSAATLAVQSRKLTAMTLDLSTSPAALPDDLLMWFSIAILGPVSEELLFRAGFQRLLGLCWRPRNAVLATALLFGFSHIQIVHFSHVFIIGFFAGVVFLRTGNFWCAVLVHATASTFGLVLQAYPAEMSWLLGFWTTIPLIGIAIWGAYMAGPRPIEPVRGIWRKAVHGLFGAAEPEAPIGQARRSATILFVFMVAMFVAYFGFQMTAVFVVRSWQLGRKNTEVQYWHVASPETIIGRSVITVAGWPGDGRTAQILLPCQQAEMTSATFGGIEIGFRKLQDGQYELTRPERESSDGLKRLELAWKLPVEALDISYGTTARSGLPVRYLEANASLDPDCGYRFGDGYPGTHRNCLMSRSITSKQHEQALRLWLERVKE